MAWTVSSWGLESAREVVNNGRMDLKQKDTVAVAFHKNLTFSESDFGKFLEIKEKQDLELINHFSVPWGSQLSCLTIHGA